MRDMTPGAQAQLQSTYIPLAVFVMMQFASSTEFVWTGRGPIDWNGHTWLGIGDLGSISPIVEDSTLTAQGITLSLSSINPTLLAEAMTEIKRGLPVMVWLVMFDASGNPSESILSYAGRMDQSTFDESPNDSATVAIAVENRLADLQRAPAHRLTDQDQRDRFPTDDGFKFVNLLLDWNGAWGAS